jgi:rod shape-determining protein MreD
MTGARLTLTATFVLLAQLLDVGVLDRLALSGTSADLLVLVVVASALAGGGVAGATVGVCAGLLADLTPPAAGLLGVNALAYGVAGAVAGRWHRPGGTADPSIVLALVAAAAAAVLMTVVHLLFGFGRHSLEQAALTCIVAALAAVVLGAVVLPVLAAVDRRVVQDNR